VNIISIRIFIISIGKLQLFVRILRLFVLQSCLNHDVTAYYRFYEVSERS